MATALTTNIGRCLAGGREGSTGLPASISLSAADLATSAGVTSAAGATSGVTLFLETDRAINVAVNNIAHLWPLADNGSLLLVGTISHLYIQNESTTNLATVELVVTD